jgi:hypothetical protein
MSIVSSRIDMQSVPARPRGKRMFKSVQRSVPGSDIEFVLPRQCPFFNISKSIAKPFLYGDAPRVKDPGRVPLKSLQDGSHAEGAALFNAPLMLIPQPLKVPIMQAGSFDFNTLVAEAMVPFDVPLDYRAGIRPSKRELKTDDIVEPGAPVYRAGSVSMGRPKMGTYDFGSDEDLGRMVRGY